MEAAKISSVPTNNQAFIVFNEKIVVIKIAEDLSALNLTTTALFTQLKIDHTSNTTKPGVWFNVCSDMFCVKKVSNKIWLLSYPVRSFHFLFRS